MPNITGHTELVGLMAYPIRHTQSPTTHNLAYDKNGDDVIPVSYTHLTLPTNSRV